MTLRARPGRPERKESCVYYTQGNPGEQSMGPWKRIVKNGKWRAQVTPARYLGNQRFGVAVTTYLTPYVPGSS